MRLLLSLFLVFFLYQTSFALDNLGRLKFAASDNISISRNSDSPKYSSLIIEISDDSAIEDIKTLGGIIVNRRDNLLLTYIPVNMVGELDRIQKVTGASLSRNAKIKLDKAIQSTNVARVISGGVFPEIYTGKGVLVGISDLGFDHGHAAFKNRVKGVVHAVDSTATVINADLATWTTDSPDDFHATHVAGILAGGDESSPYQGVARGAELFVATSTLDDVSILVGVEAIISYAKQSEKPAVINLSLGSTLGPHDGTDLFCRYLDLCAEDAAILLSAGNDGSKRVYVEKHLTSTDNIVSAMIESTNWGDVMIDKGYIDVWSNDGNTLKVRFRVWDRYLNDIVWASEWIDPSQEVYILESIKNPSFSKLYTGRLLAAAEMSSYNNRYNLTVGIDLRSTECYPEKTWSRFDLVVDISGSPGSHVEMYADGTVDFFTTSSIYPWITSGTSDMSISSMACGLNTICVGSATTRDATPIIGGGEKSWYPFVEANTTSAYSSYGTTFDGRKLPHFCAPGAYIVSAFNRYALTNHPVMTSEMAAESPNNPGHYYYAECGTSMASPHAAGIFALWLEANPSLTGPELREIAIRTASSDGVDNENPRNGAGMIDALSGLAYILNKQGISDAVSDSFLKVWREGERLKISGCNSNDIFVRIYSISGVKLFEGSPQKAILPSYPLIIQVIAPNFCVTRKIN